MVYAWLFVGLAILAEISAALFLRYSNGFTKLCPSVSALLTFGAAFYLVSLAMVHLPISTVYPIWAGGGTAGVALVGILLLKERPNALKLIGVALVVTGIVILNRV